MKEILELRINYQYAHLLFKEDEGINLGDPLFGPPSVKVVKVDTSTPLWEQVKKTCDYVYEKYKKPFTIVGTSSAYTQQKKWLRQNCSRWKSASVLNQQVRNVVRNMMNSPLVRFAALEESRCLL